MKLKDGFILRSVAGETVVVPTGNELNMNMMITLNGTGKFLWEKLENGAEEDELVQALLNEYDVDAATAKQAADAFIARLKELDFLA